LDAWVFGWLFGAASGFCPLAFAAFAASDGAMDLFGEDDDEYGFPAVHGDVAQPLRIVPISNALICKDFLFMTNR
jgi:hypothetical protein